MEVFTTSRNGFQKAVITSFQINIFEKFQILYVFSTIVSQMEAFTTPRKSVSRKPEVVKTLSRINIIEKCQILFVFSTISSQMEELTTSKNGFQKSGSSYNFVQNQHFRNMSNPIRVFRLLSLKWKHLRPAKMASRKPEVVKTSSRINIFEKCQILYLFSTIFQSNGSVNDLQKWFSENRKQL